MELLSAARGGCSRSLGEILAACRRYLLLVANRELPLELQAKAGGSDLVQETLLEAGRCFEGFHGQNENELLAWLHGILQHRLGTLRRQFQTAKRQVRQELPLGGFSSGGMGCELHDPVRSPSSWVAAREDAEMLDEALNRLPTEYAVVIRLRNQQGLSFAEVGADLGRSPDAARKLWARAVERLAAELGSSHGQR
jgi:RNA polymerase sigma-70 factor (ECF subfamily)